jgi:pimeloyl-ACP methyl ester carboxylesterase
MRTLALGALLALVIAAPAAASDPAYAPPDRAGPALDVPQDKLKQSLECSPRFDSETKTPVLLMPGTGSNAHDNFSWNYEPQFDKLGIPWCAVSFPYDGNGDVQVNGEYVVHAIRTMHARAGRKISLAGHSQGGMVGRWALRFWPDTRAMVDDVIGFAPSNHGTTQAGLTCMSSCIYANWQQSFESNFIRALNSFAETWQGISYTNVYSHNDEVVTPNSDDTGSSSLHTGSGAIRNVALQDVCPSDTSEHFLIGTTDPVAYALAIDALTHDGPADPARVSLDTCAQPYMPGIDPATGPAAGAQAFNNNRSSTGPESSSEPPLACYVLASCSTAAAAPKACSKTRKVRFRLHGHFVRVDVYLDGKRIRHKRGRRISSVSIGRLKAGKHTIKVVSVARSGKRHVSVRKVRGCKLTKPRTRRA